MTLGQALQWATYALNRNNIDDSHLEARIILGYVLNMSHAQILAQTNRNLSQSQFDSFQHLVNRRISREPTAYIVKNREFYGFDFYVDRNVLIPRPETEALVEQAIEYVNGRQSAPGYSGTPIIIADIGTGCGAIAVTLALTLSNVSIIATDISESALEVASINSHFHKVDKQITFLQGNLLNPVVESVDLIVANLPYIKTSDLSSLAPEITCFEPLIATDGGDTGLDYICRLVAQAKDKLRRQGRLLLEIGNGQEDQLFPIIYNHFPKKEINLVPDLNGINRVINIGPI